MARSSTTWARGKSGNPAGKKADATISRARARIAKNLMRVIDKVVEQALAGCIPSQKLLLERMIPLARPDDELIERIRLLEADEEVRGESDEEVC